MKRQNEAIVGEGQRALMQFDARVPGRQRASIRIRPGFIEIDYLIKSFLRWRVRETKVIRCDHVTQTGVRGLGHKTTLTIVDSGGRKTVLGRVPKETAQDAVTLINELCSPTQETG